jgi:two-component system, NtrC family, sensor histidine kinase PilS
MNPLFTEDFRNHLYYYFIIRFFFIFTVVFSFFLFPFIRENTDIFSFANKVFLSASFIIVLFNIVSLIINGSVRAKYLKVFAYTQFSVEILFWVIVSYLSGGIESPYLYVIIINIVYAGILLKEQGAIFATLFAFLLLLSQGIVIKLSLLPLISTELVELYTAKWETYFSRLFTYLLFFSFTGFVASRISKGFQQASRNLLESTHKNRELRRHFFAIFSNINMGVIILGEKFEKLYYNKYAEQFNPILDKITRKMIEDSSASGKWSEQKIADLWLSYTVMPYIEFQKVIIFSDVTSIRKKEAENEHQERMAAIGRLTASIAHEIKNPLTSLVGASELMFSEVNSDDNDQQQLVSIVKREGHRVKMLLDSLFKYTEELKYNFKECSLIEVLDDVITLFSMTNRDVLIEKNVEDIPLYTDPDRLKEVFWNIILNSSEAMSGKGNIRIYTKRKKENIEIYFEDEGGGFIEKNLDRIFDPFFSTKKRGTGLGLAQVYRIITKFGGRVSALNTEKGARVVVELVPYSGGET